VRRVEWACVALSACVGLAACAVPRLPGDAPRVRPPFADARLTAEAAAERLAVGRSTRQQVAALLGPGETLRFDSGWEAWVYRSHGARGDAVDGPELVLLFEPAGVLRKARVRAGAVATR
jgi:outer membrane protein assembly factor BamE (lipoprotein component of BamABCDE complex)